MPLLADPDLIADHRFTPGRRETFRMPSGVKITEVTDMFNPQWVACFAKWPADEYGDSFGMAFMYGADIFRDTEIGEQVLRDQRRRFEVHSPAAQWSDWSTCWPET